MCPADWKELIVSFQAFCDPVIKPLEPGSWLGAYMPRTWASTWNRVLSSCCLLDMTSPPGTVAPASMWQDGPAGSSVLFAVHCCLMGTVWQWQPLPASPPRSRPTKGETEGECLCQDNATLLCPADFCFCSLSPAACLHRSFELSLCLSTARMRQVRSVQWTGNLKALLHPCSGFLENFWILCGHWSQAHSGSLSHCCGLAMSRLWETSAGCPS